MKLVKTLEGATTLFVPPASLRSPAPPTVPVFFNPAASVNRDISVAVAAASRPGGFCDALAGIGSRGIRVATEGPSGVQATLVDLNSEALAVARRNAKANAVTHRTKLVRSEASSFLHSRIGTGNRFDAVDVDPFGSPVRFIIGALSAVTDGGMLSLTATDTAVLCGVHREVCRRRYGANPVNNHFHHENAVRILVGYLARQAASIDLGIDPVLAHSTLHYVRVYARVRVGATPAEASVGELGYVVWCPKCGHVEQSREPANACASCGSRPKCAGPLWTGKLTDAEMIGSAQAEAEKRGLGMAGRVLESLMHVDEFPPWSFSAERICSALGVQSVPNASIAGGLRKLGFRSSVQPFEKTGFKTDAGYEDVFRAVKAASRAQKLAAAG